MYPYINPHPYFPQDTYLYVYPIPIPPPHLLWPPLPIPIPTNLLPLALTSIPNLLPPHLSLHQPPIPIPHQHTYPHVKPFPIFPTTRIPTSTPIPMVSPHLPLGALPLLFPPPDSPPPQHPPLLQCSFQWNHSTDLVSTQDLIKLCCLWQLVAFLFSADIKCRAEPGLHSDWRLYFRTQMLVVSSNRSRVFWVDWTESTDAKTPERKTCSENSWTCWKGENTFFYDPSCPKFG